MTISKEVWSKNLIKTEQAYNLINNIKQLLKEEFVGINHIAYGVYKLEDIKPHLKENNIMFHIETIQAQGVTVLIADIENLRYEFLEPIDTQNSIYKFIEKKGNLSLHHIAITVKDIEKSITNLKDKIKFITDKPQKGVHNSTIIFIHPTSNNGLLTELVEPKSINKKT